MPKPKPGNMTHMLLHLIHETLKPILIYSVNEEIDMCPCVCTLYAFSSIFMHFLFKNVLIFTLFCVP